jgi:CcmD family protein
MIRTVAYLSILILVAAALPELLHAQGAMPQGGALAGQNLRGYTHMFIAYFIAWALVFGWVISIARRLKRIESALNR